MSIICTTGNLLKANTEALVNTVNCEGFMGKGIAYQFKLAYPLNNQDYIKACRNGELKIGTIHYFKENGKIIFNFPTKNKWRAKSKLEYIDLGLEALAKLIIQLNIKSISIPPLGSGNGGLLWSDVKPLIIDKLSSLSPSVIIHLYEPSKTNYSIHVLKEPKLSLSALILMKIKDRLIEFNAFRLQKGAFFMDLFSGNDYFNFSGYKYGPYDYSIDIISRNIKEFQQYHNVKDTNEAYTILYNKLISKKIDDALNTFEPYINKACAYVNNIPTTHELECLATVAYIVKHNPSIDKNSIILKFNSWSEHKAKEFSNEEIATAIDNLYKDDILGKDITGYCIAT